MRTPALFLLLPAATAFIKTRHPVRNQSFSLPYITISQRDCRAKSIEIEGVARNTENYEVTKKEEEEEARQGQRQSESAGLVEG